MKDGIEKYTKHYYTGNHLSSTQLVTDVSGVAVQQVEYAPFGEVVNEYNIDWSSGQVPDFKFNAKELDEENGMYYFEARYQSPPVFISRDVLFEARPYMSPYAYCSNSPVNRVDPSGMFDWQPEVTDEGKTQYRAEKGDNMSTFMKQYGLSAKETGTIFGKSAITKNEQIKAGETVISGETVESVTGSEILKLDWAASQATNQRKADQLFFAMKYTALKTDNNLFDMKNFYSNYQVAKGGVNLSNVTMQSKNGNRIPISNINIGITYDYTKSACYYGQTKNYSDYTLFDYYTSYNQDNIRVAIMIKVLMPYDSDFASDAWWNK